MCSFVLYSLHMLHNTSVAVACLLREYQSHLSRYQLTCLGIQYQVTDICEESK